MRVVCMYVYVWLSRHNLPQRIFALGGCWEYLDNIMFMNNIMSRTKKWEGGKSWMSTLIYSLGYLYIHCCFVVVPSAPLSLPPVFACAHTNTFTHTHTHTHTHLLTSTHSQYQVAGSVGKFQLLFTISIRCRHAGTCIIYSTVLVKWIWSGYVNASWSSWAWCKVVKFITPTDL